jgi:hypothetical protein
MNFQNFGAVAHPEIQSADQKSIPCVQVMTPANQYADMNNFMILMHQVHPVYSLQHIKILLYVL